MWPLGSDNGTYSAFIFAGEAQRVIRAHAAKHRSSEDHQIRKPLYLYVPMQNVHAPIEVPARFESLYDGVIADSHRKTFAGMVSALDEAVANITQTLAEEGLWSDTLFLFNSGTYSCRPKAKRRYANPDSTTLCADESGRVHRQRWPRWLRQQLPAA